MIDYVLNEFTMFIYGFAIGMYMYDFIYERRERRKESK